MNEKAPIPECTQNQIAKLRSFLKANEFANDRESTMTVLMTLALDNLAALTAEVDALKAKVAVLRGAYDTASQALHDLGIENVALKSEAKMRTDQLDSTLETADREWEAHEAVYRERDELKAENARLSAPVTVAELKRHGAQGLAAVSACPAINALIAARATPPQDAEKS